MNFSLEKFYEIQVIKEYLLVSKMVSVGAGLGVFHYIKKLNFQINSNKWKTPFSKNEYFRWWKVTTLLIGITVLAVLSKMINLPDWDVGLSIIMPILSYILGPPSVSFFFNSKNKIVSYIVICLSYIVCVDLSYTIYNELMGHQYFRFYNFFASSILYMIVVFFWSYNDKLKYINEDFKILRNYKRTGKVTP